MSKIKKALLTGVTYVLVAALAVGGTLAYLQDTDSDVNVMTLGNVQIEQIEQEWNADQTQLVDFTQCKPLYPYVGELGWENTTDNGGAYRRFTMENVVDKYVSVKNTGKTDAYVRTIIALEMGDYTYNEFNVVGISNNRFDGAEFKFDGAWEWTDDFVAQIDGKNYNIMVAVHKDPVKPGETTIPSLLQVYLSKNATNEVVEKMDGNKNGTYDILVFSQAIQTAGFADAKTALDTAFGDITTTNHPWADPVSSADELKEAIANGDTTVILDNDIALSEQLEVNGELTILGNGNTITAPANGSRVVNVMDNTEDVTLTLVGVKLDAADKERGISFYNNSGDLDVTIIDCEITAKYYGYNVAGLNAKANLYIKDSTLTGYCAFQTYSPNTVATFDNCVLEGVNNWYNNAQYPNANNFATVVVNSLANNSTLTFNNCTIIATEKDSATAPADQWPATQAHIIDDATGTTINWNNCTFIKNGVEVSAPESIN